MYIRAKVTAGARKEKVVQESETVFIISVREPAERNFANRRVQELLAIHYKIPSKSVHIVAGHHSPQKVFDITIE